MIWYLRCGIVGAIVVACLLLLGSCSEVEPDLQRRQYTNHEVEFLVDLVAGRGVFREKAPLSFPDGDIRSLYVWLTLPEAMEAKFLQRDWKDEAGGVLIDAWRRPLVYRFPSLRKECMFDLYSVGPNGIDERGEGDDIEVPEETTFSAWADCFKGGIVDMDWIIAHWAELKRDPVSRKPIGAPPERLQGLLPSRSLP
jgi:hypothetical protein